MRYDSRALGGFGCIGLRALTRLVRRTDREMLDQIQGKLHRSVEPASGRATEASEHIGLRLVGSFYRPQRSFGRMFISRNRKEAQTCGRNVSLPVKESL